MPVKPVQILLAEDDRSFGGVLRDYLGLHGFEVTLCENGMEAIEQFRNRSFDLCITDVMMPQKDGFTLATEIRREKPDQPLVFLTARSLKEDIVQGYRLGADDYVVKPFDSEVLLYKIRAVLQRRTNALPVEVRQDFSIGEYVYETATRVLRRGETRHRLSPKEGALLQLLCEHIGDVLPRQKALRQIWSDDNYFTARSMDVYVAKLRKLLRDDPRVQIENIHATGFRMHIADTAG